jgi:hypothetical protein
MNHFSTEEWVDFTRGLLPPAKTTAMQTALDGGCPECRSSWQLWRTVLECCSMERNYQPSEVAVQAVNSAFNIERPWRWMLSVAQFGRVLFDSVQTPALAGVRSSARFSRQITVEAEPFVIDLQLESDSAQQRVSLTGQVLGEPNAQASVSGADVILLSAENLVQKTKANQLGEFCLDFGPKGNLRLFINIGGKRAIGIALPELESSETKHGEVD